MTERQSFYLRNDLVRRNAMDALRCAPPNAVVTVAEATRSNRQNSKLWAMLNDVARSKPEGRQWTPDTWKAAFMHFLGHQVMFAESLDHSGPFPMGFRSSHLTVPQMADLITCIYEYGDRHNVDWRETKASGFYDRGEVAA